MAALALVPRHWFGRSFGWRESDEIKLRDGAKHFAAMPQQHTKVFEVLFRQIPQNREINGVLGEALSVISHSERRQPLGNIFHGSLHRSERKNTGSADDANTFAS